MREQRSELRIAAVDREDVESTLAGARALRDDALRRVATEIDDRVGHDLTAEGGNARSNLPCRSFSITACIIQMPL